MLAQKNALYPTIGQSLERSDWVAMYDVAMSVMAALCAVTCAAAARKNFNGIPLVSCTPDSDGIMAEYR